MRQAKFTYEKAEQCFFEAMRVVKRKGTEWISSRERNALIDSHLTDQNVVIKVHECLDVKNYKSGYKRGTSIAKYHKDVSKRAARMNGSESQKSKAIGCIITLPRLDLDKNIYSGLEILESQEFCNKRELIKEKIDWNNLRQYRKNYTESERAEISDFLTKAYKAWLKNASIREEDVLYAIIHFDESTPHAHIMALPSDLRENGTPTFSTARFNKEYYRDMHQNIINILQNEYRETKYSPYLLNGVMKNKSNQDFNAYTQEQRILSINNQNMIKAETQVIDSLNNDEKRIRDKIIELKEHVAVPLKEEITSNMIENTKLKVENEKLITMNNDLTSTNNKLKAKNDKLSKQFKEYKNHNKAYKPLYEQALHFITILFNAFTTFLNILRKRHNLKYELSDIVDEEMIDDNRDILEDASLFDDENLVM